VGELQRRGAVTCGPHGRGSPQVLVDGDAATTFEGDAGCLQPQVVGRGRASDGDEQVQISRVGVSAASGPAQKLATGLELAEVIRQVANLGATYPEILGLLQAADRQKNLPTAAGSTASLVVDALPATLAAYEEAQIAGKDATAKVDPALERTALEKSKAKAPRKGLTGRIFRRGK